MKLFGTSGIRRLYAKDLLRVALNVGLAVGNLYSKVVVGRDTRTSGEILKNALLAGLAAGGSKGYDAGIAPTPTIALAAKEFSAGIMVTASHNPPEYNGIKLLKPDGSAFDPHEEKKIEQMIEEDSVSAIPWDKIAESNIYEGAVEKHIERILSKFPSKFKVKVVVDCGCGAASVITPHLLKRMGCDVIGLNCQPGGFFPHSMEPTEASMQDLMKATREWGADIGIFHDGDADRMMVVDDKGRLVNGDKMLAIFAKGLKAKKVVTTIDASMAIEEMGFEVVRTRVGDPAVSVELRKGGDFGGEPSGSWIFPEISLCPDGIYAAAQAVAIASQHKLSQLADGIPSYPVLRGSTSSQGVVISELKRRLRDMNPVAVNDTDGIKLNFEDSWLLIRASGTEPKMRITAEARSEKRAQQLYDAGVNAIKESTWV